MNPVDALLGLVRLEAEHGLPSDEMVRQIEERVARPFRAVITLGPRDKPYRYFWNYDYVPGFVPAAPTPTGIDCLLHGGFLRRMWWRLFEKAD